MLQFDIEKHAADFVASFLQKYANPITTPAQQQPAAAAPVAPKMVMRAAPSVPNPIVPPHQSAMPLPGSVKAAVEAAIAAPQIAKNYTMSSTAGRRLMPRPHNIQLRKMPTPAVSGKVAQVLQELFRG